MKKRNNNDSLEILQRFQKDIMLNKPDKKEMIHEIQMMKFKIKPIQGDLMGLNFENSKFIEIVWKLGKIDEFFQTHHKKIAKDQRGTFFFYLESMQRQLQDELNKLNLQNRGRLPKIGVLELEIFKEKKNTDKNN